MSTIKDSVAFVTGAAGGLGKEWVAQLLAKGAAKIYAADLIPGEWCSKKIIPVQLDITNLDSIKKAATLASDTTLLINNAGIASKGPLSTTDEAVLRRVFDVDFFGTVRITQEFTTILNKNQGAIINVVSAMAWGAIAGAYSTAKAALWSATNAFRFELRHQGIHVVGVYVAYIDTPMTESLDVPKISPSAVVLAGLTAVENGEYEVLLDDLTRKVRAALASSIPVELVLGDQKGINPSASKKSKHAID